jgi:hypothetical protein
MMAVFSFPLYHIISVFSFPLDHSALTRDYSTLQHTVHSYVSFMSLSHKIFNFESKQFVSYSNKVQQNHINQLQFLIFF